MADDQNPKPSTIDDLVKQLSRQGGEARSEGAANQGGQKPYSSAMPSPNQPPPLSASAGGSTESAFGQMKSASQGPPSNLPGVKIETKSSPFPQPSRPVQPATPLPQMSPFQPPKKPTIPPVTSVPQPPPMASVGTTKPPLPLSSPPKPQTPAPSLLPSKPSPVQEYRSSIRTMSEDVTSIKSGQKPLGVDIPRKITLELPQIGAVTPKPTAPTSPPAGPLPSSVGLGRAEKTTPLAPPPGIKKPTEMPKPGIQPPITVPAEKKWLGGLNLNFYLIVAGILVVGGFLYWFLALRVSEVAVSPTPPLQTATPTPTAKNLSDIFTGEYVNFMVSGSEDLGSDFKTFINSLEVPRKGFSKVSLVEKELDDTFLPLSFLDMFDGGLVIYPVDLRENVADSIVVVYGQTEAFNSDGSVSLSPSNQKKSAFIARVKDKVAVKTMMEDWELTIADDLAEYLIIPDTSKETSVNFLDNTYGGVPIRYKNFPLPDVTVDYTVVDANGQGYLIISSSRESTYAAIDILLGR